jgi:hypothetical protein
VAQPATSSNGGTITYSATTPNTCTVDASGNVTLAGQAAGNCTISAVSSAGGTASKTITINTKIVDTVSCAPDAPRAGDTFSEKIDSRSNAYNMPRTITNSSPNNPVFRSMKTVTATYSYSAGTGANINLNTTNVTNSGAAANPAVPAGAWDGAVPLPVWGGLPKITAGSNPDGSDTYVFSSTGNIVNVPKRPPNAASKAGGQDLLPVQETIPFDWQRQIAIARDAAGTAPGSVVAGYAFADKKLVTIRQTGGLLNSLQYSIQGGTTGGATYNELRYYVEATFDGFQTMPTGTTTEKGGAQSSSNPIINNAGSTLSTANGKLQYGNFCKFTYTFRKMSLNANGSLQQAADSAAWDGVSPYKADTSAACTGNCGTFSNINTILAGPGQSIGDWKGTFYSHNNLPRIAKHFVTAIGRSGGANAVAGGDTTPQGNGSYYDFKTGNNVGTDTPSSSGSTPPSNRDERIQTINRLVLP